MTEELKSIIRHLDYATQEDEDQAIGYLRRLMPQWTTEKPKEAGWYWWKGRPDVMPEIHYVSEHDIEDGNPPGLWAGPIPPPEPQEA